MSLRSTLTELIATADRVGRAGPRRLAGGAHLEVRSKAEPAADGATRRRRQLRISRNGVEPGATEIETFRRDAKIPPEGVEAAYVYGATYVTTVTWDELIYPLPLEALPG